MSARGWNCASETRCQSILALKWTSRLAAIGCLLSSDGERLTWADLGRCRLVATTSTLSNAKRATLFPPNQPEFERSDVVCDLLNLISSAQFEPMMSLNTHVSRELCRQQRSRTPSEIDSQFNAVISERSLDLDLELKLLANER